MTSCYYDPLGSAVVFTTEDGTLGVRYAYDEYGAPQAMTGSLFGYTGALYTSQAGSAPWNMRNRQYHPGLGRFLQTDPIGIAGGINLYAYVGGDPVNAVDPFGLNEVDPIVVTGTRRPMCTVGLTCERGGPLIDTYGGGLSGGPYVEVWNERGVTEVGPIIVTAQRECSTDPGESLIGSARLTLESLALGADIATVGLAALGVTAPVATAAKSLGYIAEGGLLILNIADWLINGNGGALSAQIAGGVTRLIPGGRTAQYTSRLLRNQAAGAEATIVGRQHFVGGVTRLATCN